MATIITARNLHKSYRTQGSVLNGVDITVSEGEFISIMGPSGCGKSTLLHLLGLLHSPDSGVLNILNTDVRKLEQNGATIFRRENMGFILQSNNMFPHTTVYENVEFPLIFNRVPRQVRPERIQKALEQVKLGGKINAWSNSLSGGEQQRVAIARALVNNPKILLADEPTGALDSSNSHSLMRLFRAICEDKGVSVIMVTHDPNMAKYSDRTYGLEEGKIASIN